MDAPGHHILADARLAVQQECDRFVGDPAGTRDRGLHCRIAGVETGQRVGLPRATANGWLSVAAVRRAIVAAVVLAVLLGLPLVWRSGLPVLLLGLASIAAALGYMGGRWPIAYTPLGEFTVFVFFGLADGTLSISPLDSLDLTPSCADRNI